MQKALEVIGFQQEEVVQVFQLVAAVLKLGNLTFLHQSNMDGTDGCKLSNDHGMHTHTRQWGRWGWGWMFLT